MRLAIPHFTTRENARRIIQQRLDVAVRQYGNFADDLSHSWQGDVLSFTVKARGISASGTVDVTDKEVIIDGKLPLMALPFEGRIKTAVKQEAESLFRQA